MVLERRVNAGGGRAQHRRPEQYGIRFGRQRDGQAERVGMSSKPPFVGRAATGGDDCVDEDTPVSHRFDDVAGRVGERLHSGQEPGRERVDIVVQRPSHEPTAQIWIGQRRAVPQNARLQMDVLGEGDHRRRVDRVAPQ